MILKLFHGRKDPDQEMTDWGFEGPEIHGVTTVQFQYGVEHIIFKTPDLMEVARKATEWEPSEFYENALVMKRRENQNNGAEYLIEIKGDFYGDYEMGVPLATRRGKEKPAEAAIT